jgi:phosphoribosylpyrophosphate synthetase
MPDYITLIGADDVRSAASTMSSAADRMEHAASNMAYAFESHQRFLEDWLSRLQQAMEKPDA